MGFELWWALKNNGENLIKNGKKFSVLFLGSTYQQKSVTFSVPATSTSASYTVTGINKIVGIVSCSNNYWAYALQSCSFTDNKISVSGYRHNQNLAAGIDVTILYEWWIFP